MATIPAAKDDPTAALTWVERGLRIESSSGRASGSADR